VHRAASKIRGKVGGRSERKSRRGRPPKYGTRSQIVAVTLPRKTVAALARLHSDLGWAIVGLVEKTQQLKSAGPAARDVQLVEVGDGSFLIVVNRERFHTLPGIQLVPLSATQAFLALDPGGGLADLELAVLERLEQLKTPSRERRAMSDLSSQLRRWRRDPHLQSHTRSIIIVTKRRRER
jgi:hypothetical protein